MTAERRTVPKPSRQEAHRRAEIFFREMGIVRVEDFEQSARALPPDVMNAWKEFGEAADTPNEMLAFEYRHDAYVPIVLGTDLKRIIACAELLGVLPAPRDGGAVLDVGGGPGHLSLWMLSCWSISRVVVLDPCASAVSRTWTAQLPQTPVHFVDGALLDDISAVADDRFDRIVVAACLKSATAPPFEEDAQRIDLRPALADALSSLRPLLAPGGDVVVLEHFHGVNRKSVGWIAEAAEVAGLKPATPKWWWGDRGHCTPYQLRFVAS